MLILRLGIYSATLAAAYVTWASSGAGFPIEVAMARGLLAFMAVTFLAYLAELVVLTAPPADRRRDDTHAPSSHVEDDEDDDEDMTANLPAVRAERDAAADQRRAA